MFVAWLHLLQSLQPDRIVLDGEEGGGKKKKREIRAKWHRDVSMKRADAEVDEIFVI